MFRLALTLISLLFTGTATFAETKVGIVAPLSGPIGIPLKYTIITEPRIVEYLNISNVQFIFHDNQYDCSRHAAYISALVHERASVIVTGPFSNHCNSNLPDSPNIIEFGFLSSSSFPQRDGNRSIGIGLTTDRAARIQSALRSALGIDNLTPVLQWTPSCNDLLPASMRFATVCFELPNVEDPLDFSLFENSFLTSGQHGWYHLYFSAITVASRLAEAIELNSEVRVSGLDEINTLVGGLNFHNGSLIDIPVNIILDANTNNGAISNLLGSFCPDCAGSTKICGSTCPSECNNSCTAEGNIYCCTKSGMPVPPQ